MQVLDAYKSYQTPPTLQTHMLRVASLAKIIVDNWNKTEIDKDAIIQSCLLHDIAKPINFDLKKQAAFGMTPDKITELAKLQDRIRGTYGSDEHHAVVAIAKEIGCCEKTVQLIDHLEWGNIQKFLENNDLESLIPVYCDMRIGPKGILSLVGRLNELHTRVPRQNYDEDLQNGNRLEQRIQANVTINLNSITETQLTKQFETLTQIAF